MSNTLYWYDLETFGIDPRYYRIAQFAGIRTDLDLNVISDPTVIYCQPSDDFLPDPESCLVTRITPQIALQKGNRETEFFKIILAEFARPNTCVVGYNNIRFDDEHIRYGLYRNLYDPYAREWQYGNSRWDIIDMVRLTRALRPNGINWPSHADGTASFRLEDITQANGISHSNAHDALSDVMATIEVAKLIRDKQLKLYQYAFNHRNKHLISQLLNIRDSTPVLHISSMYPAAHGCAAVVVPIAVHPINKNGYIVYDLGVDPKAFSDLDTDELKHRLFTPRDELGEGMERLPLKTVHINKCPIIAPLNTLDDESAQRLGINISECMKNLATLKALKNLREDISTIFCQPPERSLLDADSALYQGFFSDADREKMQLVHKKSGPSLVNMDLVFDDKRLPELYFRFKARNYPEILTNDEQAQWDAYRIARLTEDNGGQFINYKQYQSSIQTLRMAVDVEKSTVALLDTLDEYGMQIVTP